MKTETPGHVAAHGSGRIIACCRSDKVSRFGTGIRISSFGFPNALLDLALYEHPQLTGTAMSFELHSYGEKGPQSVFSGIYCLEYSRMAGEGYWRVEQLRQPGVRFRRDHPDQFHRHHLDAYFPQFSRSIPISAAASASAA